MKQIKPALIPGLLLLAGVCFADVETKNLRCEYLVNPLGIDATRPRLSWIITANQRGEKQTAYQVLVASTERGLSQDQGDLWDSGKVASGETAQIEYAGRPLASRQSCYWKVRTWDRAGKSGAWSPAAQWHMGLLQPTDWSAKWIVAESPPAPAAGVLVIRKATYEGIEKGGAADVTAALTRLVKDNRLNVEVNNKNLGGDPAQNIVKRLRVEYELGGTPFTKEIDENQTLSIPEELAGVRYLRKPFQMKSPVQRAVLYATALGLYEVQLNGRCVGDHVLAPDWTDYRKRVRYQAYDVTALIQPGDNAIGALLANGWFSGRIGNGANQFFGKVPAFLAQLEVTFADGSTKRIATDSTWKSQRSPILTTDFMLGETHDARLEIKDWAKAGLDDSEWTTVAVRDESARKLEAQSHGARATDSRAELPERSRNRSPAVGFLTWVKTWSAWFA
ncbi:MAG: alpha-L-rhamnosidase N-terminal domain-containing protein [Verrucomicrobiota bacterium]